MEGVSLLEPFVETSNALWDAWGGEVARGNNDVVVDVVGASILVGVVNDLDNPVLTPRVVADVNDL